ncbi:MAG: DUF1961 family protein [candidate division KSB1 bacterium]|nr:DUF1961 family protein [candidate division KSB1 bacterium]
MNSTCRTFRRAAGFLPLLLFLIACTGGEKSEQIDPLIDPGAVDPFEQAKGDLLYKNPMSDSVLMADWVMEGPGQLEFKDSWMHMHAHDWHWIQWISTPGHHVFWCPMDFPDRFIAEWQAQNIKPKAGLCIVFFAAQGVNSRSIFNPALPERQGRFKSYINGRINNYHISYYANAPHNPDRRRSHLRKNSGFHLAQIGYEGIPTASKRIHHMKLIKDGGHIVMYVDHRCIIDWTDDGQIAGPMLRNGKIGFRQMRWSHFRYRDFKVWSIKD